jgi:hypothetical protein
LSPRSHRAMGENLYRGVDLRDSVPLTRHMLGFDVDAPESTVSRDRNPDKKQLRAEILAMRARGMSYRKIGTVLGLHWTRVGQVLNEMVKLN